MLSREKKMISDFFPGRAYKQRVVVSTLTANQIGFNLYLKIPRLESREWKNPDENKKDHVYRIFANIQT